MVEFWYDDAVIGHQTYEAEAPVVGDILQWQFDGELREFRVDAIRKFFPEGQDVVTRTYLKVWGHWDL